MPTIGDRDKLGYTIIWSRIYNVIPMLPAPPPQPSPPHPTPPDKDCSLPHLVLQDSGLEHSLFLYPKPMGYCPKLGAWAKLGGLQVYGVSEFQVYDRRIQSAAGEIRCPEAASHSKPSQMYMILL